MDTITIAMIGTWLVGMTGYISYKNFCNKNNNAKKFRYKTLTTYIKKGKKIDKAINDSISSDKWFK